MNFCEKPGGVKNAVKFLNFKAGISILPDETVEM